MAKLCRWCHLPKAECICEPDEDETPAPFEVKFTAPPWPPREDA